MFHEFKSGKITPRELVRIASSIYKENLKYIAMIGIGVYLPINLVILLASANLDLNAAYTSGDISGLLRFMSVMLVFTIVVLPLETAAVTHLTQKKLDNGTATTESIFETSLGNWGRLAITAALYVLIVGFCSFLIIPAIILGVSFYFYAHIVAVNKTYGIIALRESVDIVKGRWWRTFVTLLMISLFEVVFRQLFGSVASVLINQVSGESAVVLVNILRISIVLIADVLSLIFRIIAALYFFNLYYTAKPVNVGSIG